MQFPENIPKIPAIIGIVLLVAISAAGAITLSGLNDQSNAPVQQGISDEEAQKIIANENATQEPVNPEIETDRPATDEEIEAFKKYAENEQKSVKAARTTRITYNPVSQPPAQNPPPSIEVIGGELISEEETDPDDIPDDSAFQEPQENYDDDIPEEDNEEQIPGNIVIPINEDDEGYYTDEPYDPFDDDVFEVDEDGEEDPEEGEGDE